MDARSGAKPPETTAVTPTGLVAPPSGHSVALSPINRRRWENFKANRRGYWSLWVFLVLFAVSLCAEFIANDKPLLIETIFSLDGLGLLGFESVLNRDYAVVFATLYIFSLVGLVVNLISDITYMLVDPRIDFETREV